MKTYKLYVCMPTAKFYVDVKANSCKNKKGRLTFFKNNSNKHLPRVRVASYPSQYTIIEKIIENK